MAQANDLLSHPRDIDLSVSQRLGLHVVTRLAARHRIQVSLTPTPGAGVTAVVVLPAELFAAAPSTQPPLPLPLRIPQPRGSAGTTPQPNGYGGPSGYGNRGLHSRSEHNPVRDPEHGNAAHWIGWWTPTRLPTVETSSWQTTPVYATAEKIPVPAPLPAPTRVPSKPPVVATGALPARPPRWTSNAHDEDAVATASPAAQAPPGPLLRRRVPQSNLVPELRRDSTENPAPSPEATGHPDAERARDALSRYQASRQAAQEQVDGAAGSRS
jgi:hypothetical protein